MRNAMLTCLACLAFLVSSCGSQQEAEQPQEQATTDRAGAETVQEPQADKETSAQPGEPVLAGVKIQCGETGNLAEQPTVSEYLPFRDETAITVGEYGIYYDRATARLSWPSVDGRDGVMKIEYELPPHFPWGNWLSVCKQFTSVLDMSGCEGLELELQVELPSNAKLRLTMSDVRSLAEFQKHGHKVDEMWWYDFDNGTLKEKNGWVKLRAPFNDFYASRGAGTRHNNGKKDISKIVSYEINVVLEGDVIAAGTFLVHGIHAY